MQVKSWCTIFAVAPFNSKCLTFYLKAITTFTLSLTAYEIFANQIKYPSLNLKMKVMVKKNKNWIDAVRLEMFDCMWMVFQNCIYLATYAYARATNIHTHTQMITIGKICKAHLHKNQTFTLGTINCARSHSNISTIMPKRSILPISKQVKLT